MSRCPEADGVARCIYEDGHAGPHIAKDATDYIIWGGEECLAAPGAKEGCEMKNRKRAGSAMLCELRAEGYGVAVSHGEYEGHPNKGRPESLDGLRRHYTLVRIHARVGLGEDLGPELARGHALCRPGDQFDRRLGLTIAAGRARIALNRRLIGG